jgi:hypothetical protein
MKYTKEEQAVNRKKWIAALRSGKYKQGYGRLNIGNEFCCLGVACELAYFEGVVTKQEDNYSYYYCYNKSFNTLPESVIDWLGIITESGRLKEKIEIKNPNDTLESLWSLVDVNDSIKFTFNDIADLIEQEKVEFINTESYKNTKI